MTKFKKLILGLGSLGAVAAPIASVVSCGAEIATNPADKHEGEGVAWDRSNLTASFNLCEATSVAPFKAWMKMEDGFAKEGSVPALKIAKAWEKAAGYSVDDQGNYVNPRGIAKIKEGEIVHVQMAAQMQVIEKGNELHAFDVERWVPFKLEYSFPFHTFENMKYHDSLTSANDPLASSKELTDDQRAFYTYSKPYSIHTNFWKALLAALRLGFTKDASNTSWATAGNAGTLTGNTVYSGVSSTWTENAAITTTGSTTVSGSGSTATTTRTGIDYVQHIWSNKVLKLKDWQVN